MNHIYKVIFCKATGTFVAVAEFARANGKKGSGTVGAVSATSEAGSVSRYAMGLSGLTKLSAAILLSLGLNSTVFAVDATCTGPANQNVGGNDSEVACGEGATATGTNAIAIGKGSQAVGNQGNISIGSGSTANNSNGTAIGFGAQVTGINSTAVGQGATASNEQTTAFGNGARATGNQATAIGSASQATGDQTVAVGRGNVADANRAVALGFFVKANGAFSTVVGNSATASSTATQAVVIGSGTKASLANTTVIGSSASAEGQAGDVALGQSSSTAAVNNSGTYRVNSTIGANTAAAITPKSVVSVGSAGNERRITNVAAANINATSTDAVNGSQLFITSTALNEAAKATQDALGGGAVTNPATGVYTAPSYTLTNNPNGGAGSTTTSNNVGRALSTLDTAVNRSITVAGNSGSTAQKLGSTLNISGGAMGDSSNSNVKTVVTDGKVDIQLLDAPTFAGQVKANGFDASGAKIINVQDGTAAKDAVNRGQLDALATAGKANTDALGNSTATNLGGGAIYDATTGTVGAPTYSVNGQNSNNVGAAISALDKGFTLQTNGANGAAIKAGDTVDIGTADAENNLEVVKTNNTIKYSLKKNLDLGEMGSVTTGNTVTNNAGVTIDDKAGNVTQMTAAGTNVTDGTNTSNYGAAGSTVTDGTNTTTTGPTSVMVSNGTDTSTIGADSISAGGANPVAVNGKDGVVTGLTNTSYDEAQVVRNRAATEGQVSDVANSLGDLADTPLTFTGNSGSTAQKLGSTLNISGGATGDSSNSNVKTVVTDGKVDIQLLDAPTFAGQVKANGFDANNNKIVNVQDGTAAKDAVNRGQLDALATAGKANTDALGNSTATNLGGGAIYDATTGTVSAPMYSVNGQNSNNVGAAISALDKGFTLQTNGANGAAIKAGDTVDIGTADAENNLEVVKTNNTIKYSLKKNLDLGETGSVTTGNTVTNNAGVTIDDKAGNVTQMTAAGTNVTDGTNTSNYGAAGSTVTDGTNTTTTGPAGVTVSNGTDTSTIGADSISAGGANPVVVNGKDGVVTGLTNTSYDEAQVVRNRAATEGQVSDVANSLGNLADTPLTFTGNSGTTAQKLGSTLNISGGATGDSSNSNVKTVVTDGKVDIQLLDAPTFAGQVKANGFDANNNKIVNVQDGTAAKDAVNRGQLDALATAGKANTDALGNSTATNLGGGATYDDKTGTVSAPTYSVNGTDSNNVGAAISALDQGFTLQTNGANGAAIKAGDTVDIGTADAENNLEVVKTNNTIKYSLKKNLDLGETGSVTTGNTVTNNAGVTIDDKAGNVTQMTAAGTNVTDGTNTSNYGAAGSTVTDGTNTSTTAANGITVSDQTGAGTRYGSEGFNFVDTNGDIITNAPSITRAGINAGNTVIKNVAAGTVAKDSTDAINGNQLFETNQAIANAQGQANKGFNISADNGTTDNVQLGDTVKYSNTDKNLVATVYDNGINYDLADDISVKTVTANDRNGNVTALTATGTTVTDGINTSSYGAAGSSVTDGTNTTNVAADNITVGGANPVVISGKDGNITGLTNTSYDKTQVVGNRAATEGQVSDVANSLGNLADTPLTFTGNSGTTAQKLGSTLNISGGATAAASNSNIKTVVSNGNIDIQFVDAPTFTGQVKANGFDASGAKIINIANGTAANDAVNKGQLDAIANSNNAKNDALGNSTANNLGGGSKYDPVTGQVTAPNYKVQGGAQNNVGDALDTLDGAINNIKAANESLSNSAVQYDKNADGSINKDRVTLGGGADGTTLTNVKNGKVAKGSKDAITGDQLFQTEQRVESNTTDINNLKNDINNGGVGLVKQDAITQEIKVAADKGGNSVNMSGTAGDRTVSGVKAGAVTAKSNEAVNGSQLHAANTNISNALGGGSKVDASGNITAPSYSVAGEAYTDVGSALAAVDSASLKRFDSLNSRIDDAFYYTNDRIDEVEKQGNAGIAAALSLESAPYIPGKFTYSIGAGYHRGENAIGGSLRRTADSGRWSLTGGVATDSEGGASARIGISGVIN